MAGGGTGKVPWDMVTVPVPTFRGEATKRDAPSQRSAMTPPTMSTIESTAPTSWKCTFSTEVPWTAASASASRRNSAADSLLHLGVEARLLEQRQDAPQVPVGLLALVHQHVDLRGARGRSG